MAFLRSQQREWQQRYQHQRIDLFGSTSRKKGTASSDGDGWVSSIPSPPSPQCS